MLKKIENLSCIGVYHSYKSSGAGLDFSKNTVIFANNGYGKSTLVAVLRSMEENSSTPILERKTLGSSNSQFAIISVPGGVVKFEDDKWGVHTAQENVPKLVIFDEHFVQENLFIKEIEAGHKKKIYQLIIGKEGRVLADKLNEEIKLEKEKRKIFQDFVKQNESKKLSADTENYLKLTESMKKDSEDELLTINSKLNAKENINEITGLLEFETLEQDYYEFSNSQKLLSTTIESIHEEAQEKVQAHIAEHLKSHPKGEEFLRIGTEIQAEGCPYCGEAVDKTKGLLKSYQSYFDDAYKTFQESIDSEISKIELWDFNEEINRIEQWMNKCETQIFELKKIAGEEVQMTIKDLSSISKKIDTQVKVLKKQLIGKKMTPGDVNEAKTVTNLDSIKDEIALEINSFNDHIKLVTSKYMHLLDSANEESEIELKRKKEICESRINRYSDSEVSWCSDYTIAKTDLEAVEKQREKIEEDITSKTKESFEKFEKGTNKYLKDLRANFQIGSLLSDSNNVSSEAFVEFNIVINEVSLDLKSKARSPKPQFSNTLSSGDKNTLSLAFFFAWLDLQQNISELIVVFDDPLTSLDDNRRLGTSKVLSVFSKKILQMVILTHKRDFLHQLDDELKDLKGISIRNDIKNGSKLVPLDIKEDRKDVHFQRIDEMRRYLTEDFGPSVKDMQENIRKVIERVLKLKYYPAFETLNTLGLMLDYLAEKSILTEEIIEELRKLKNISDSVHHAEETGKPIQNLERDDLIPEIGKTLEIIKTI